MSEGRETDLAVLQIGVFQLVPFARNRPQTGHQQRDLLRQHAQLAHVRAARNAVDSDDVAGTEILVDLLEVLFFLRLRR